jgi:hypothetical protein
VSGSPLPHLTFATQRKLPKASTVPGRVAVLDIAFAADGTGHSFDKVTRPFLDGLGERLAVWVDHHDHELHARAIWTQSISEVHQVEAHDGFRYRHRGLGCAP